jgi:hypothetical protein
MRLTGAKWTSVSPTSKSTPRIFCSLATACGISFCTPESCVLSGRRIPQDDLPVKLSPGRHDSATAAPRARRSRTNAACRGRNKKAGDPRRFQRRESHGRGQAMYLLPPTPTELHIAAPSPGPVRRSSPDTTPEANRPRTRCSSPQDRRCCRHIPSSKWNPRPMQGRQAQRPS